MKRPTENYIQNFQIYGVSWYVSEVQTTLPQAKNSLAKEEPVIYNDSKGNPTALSQLLDIIEQEMSTTGEYPAVIVLSLKGYTDVLRCIHPEMQDPVRYNKSVAIAGVEIRCED